MIANKFKIFLYNVVYALQYIDVFIYMYAQYTSLEATGRWNRLCIKWRQIFSKSLSRGPIYGMHKDLKCIAIPPTQNGYHQENRKQQTVTQVREKKSHCSLLIQLLSGYHSILYGVPFKIQIGTSKKFSHTISQS